MKLWTRVEKTVLRTLQFAGCSRYVIEPCNSRASKKGVGRESPRVKAWRVESGGAQVKCRIHSRLRVDPLDPAILRACTMVQSFVEFMHHATLKCKFATPILPPMIQFKIALVIHGRLLHANWYQPRNLHQRRGADEAIALSILLLMRALRS